MAFFRRRTTAGKQTDQAEKQRAKREDFTLQWDFGEADAEGQYTVTPLDDSAYTLRSAATIDEISAEAGHRNVRALWSTTPLSKPWQAPMVDSNVDAVRTALDNALEQWWSDGTLPAKPLVRDGLLALEAGHDLDEGHRSLLLRAALAYRRGMVTALHHQTDGERTAFMLKEMLLAPHAPLAPEFLWGLSQEDTKSATWTAWLISELQYELQLVSVEQQQLVQQALDYLQGIRTPKTTHTTPGPLANRMLSVAATQLASPPTMRPYWTYGRLLVMAVLALLVTVMLVTRWQSTAAAGAATIPAGVYTIRDTSQPPKAYKVELPAFAIDRTEVTNREYEGCYRAGVCPEPSSHASATRNDYFLAPAFADFPVVNVTWAAANQYCQWQGKTLPTAEQWQVAASIAPATQRAFRYPWGEQFDSHLANTQVTGLLDTKLVGAYHPNGDSGFGVMDMAGNVAEWTATNAPTDSTAHLVKGGSFQDKPQDATTDAQQSEPDQSSASWLGFRCIAELAD